MAKLLVSSTMVAPILTEMAWSKSKYYSYVLCPNGSLIGTVHPPGFAWLVNNNSNQSTIPDDMKFILSRNQLCCSRWFVAALLTRPFWCLKIGSSYQCQLILAMGAKVTAKLLLNRDVKIY